MPLDSATLQASFDLAPIGVTLTRDGVTEYCNPAYLAMFGYTDHSDEIYGKSLLSMVAPEQREAIIDHIQKRRVGIEAEAAYDSLGLRRDGSVFPFHVSVRRVEIQDGPVTLAFFMDMTERRRIEETLRQSNEQLNALIQACPVPIMLLDPAGTVRLWNPAAERTFGFTEAEAIGKPNPVVDEASRAEFRRNMEGAMATGIQGVQARRRRKDGSPIDLAIWAAPIRDQSGASAGTMALTVDVSERLRTEAALARSQEQLRHAQKMEAVGRLAGGVAHDFNNLLTVISGFSALLRTQIPGQEAALGSAKEIENAVGRAAALTRQLLIFSRQQPVSTTVVDLNEVVSSMERMLSRLMAPETRLERLLAVELGRVRADTGQLEQVITNLVINASDAMPAGGQVRLSTSNVELDDALGSRFVVPAGRYVVLEVRDTGMGMDEAVLSRLFEPFFTTKERGKGTGLGLSTVYGIVTQSGGHLQVESQPGSGSTFRVYLPRVDELPRDAVVPERRIPARARGPFW
ncbi:MAG: PAS domain S-box protein [Myxococcales bacterium]|nr:PAS domain S-box protein [Myxococcales bacterium]